MSLRRRGDSEGSYVQLESNSPVVSQLAHQDTIPWYRKRNLRLLYFLMIPACLAVEMTNGYDASMVNGLQAVSSWLEYYHHPRSASLGLMASMYSLGCVTAVPFAPFVVDKIGRRYPILFASIILIIGSILQGCALNFVMFITARFILGFADIFCIVAGSSLIGELSHPKERALMLGFFNAFYALGAIAAAAVTFGTFAMKSNWGWRIPSFLQMVPSICQASFIWFLPESPRWLVSKGRGDEAFAILVKYHGEGDENSEFVKAEYVEIKEALEAGQKITQINRKAVFSTPGMQKRVMIATFLGLCAHWCGAGLLSSFLSPVLDNIGIHDNRTKNIVSLARVCWNSISSTAAVLVVPRYSRRGIYLACTTSLFITFTALTAANAEYSFSHNRVSAYIVLAFIFLHSSAYDLGFIALNCTFLVELFPFHARSSGIAIYQWWKRAGAFFLQFVNPIGIDVAGWRWYIVYCVWNVFQVVFVYLMFPETSGRTLEELTFLYEDDREVFQHGGVEILHEHGRTEAYGTMGPRRVMNHEQG